MFGVPYIAEPCTVSQTKVMMKTKRILEKIHSMSCGRYWLAGLFRLFTAFLDTSKALWLAKTVKAFVFIAIVSTPKKHQICTVNAHFKAQEITWPIKSFPWCDITWYRLSYSKSPAIKLIFVGQADSDSFKFSSHDSFFGSNYFLVSFHRLEMLIRFKVGSQK